MRSLKNRINNPKGEIAMKMLIFSLIAALNLTGSCYSDCGVIMQEPKSEIAITMQNGNVFSFEDSDGDWQKGDIVSVIFYDKGTKEVSDDVILKIRYSGWISDNELKFWVK